MATTTPTFSIATRAKLFRGFSDASRLGILEALRSGPGNVGDLVLLRVADKLLSEVALGVDACARYMGVEDA